MKLAVVFLCLGITCLVDAKTGSSQQWKLTDAEAHNYAQTVYNICAQADKAKTGSAKERKANQLCLIEELDSFLNSLSVTVGCTVDQLLGLLGVSPEATQLMQAGDFLGVLDVIDLEAVLESTVLLVEGILANAGYLLQSLVVQIQSALGSGSSLPSSLSILSGSIDGILFSLRSTAIGDLLASLSGALSGVLSGLTGGGKGGIAGGLPIPLFGGSG